MHYLHTIDYVVIVAFLVFITVVGMILTRKASKSLDHYFLGNRSMPWWLLGISGMSNWFDLTGTMIITSFLFMLGPRGLFIEFRGGAVLILAFMLAYAGKWHRRSGCMTGAEWLEYRFGRMKSVEAVRVVKAIVTIVVTVVIVAYLVRGTSLFLGTIFPYPPAVMTIILVGLTALYTMCAGFYGVVITDMIQGVIIIASSVAVAVMAWMLVPDAQHLAATAQAVTGNSQWIESLPAWHTTMPKGYEAYQALTLFTGFYLLRTLIDGSGRGDESRYFGAKSDRDCGLLSFLQGITVMFRWPLMLGFAVMGIYLVHQMYPDPGVIARASELIHAQYPALVEGQWHDFTSRIAANPQAFPSALIDGLTSALGSDWRGKLAIVSYRGTVNPEQILPAVLINKVPAGMAGLLIVAMLAAMKGSLAGVINGASAYFVKDIYQTVWRPKASNRELIAASWLSTMAMMGVGLAMGLSASSINNIWGWLMMSLTAGSLAPAALRLYWWRCNGWGVAGGLVLGSVGALVQRFAWPDMVEWQQFLFMTGLSFLGTVGGSLLTAPTPLETLRHFYRTTRPFGWWRPLWNELEPGERAAWRKEHRNDILTVPFALLWQVTLFLLPMQLVIKSYDAFWKTLPFFLLALGGMYWFWWRNLPPARSQEENATGMGMKQ
jgi:Na+/proline symporter